MISSNFLQGHEGKVRNPKGSASYQTTQSFSIVVWTSCTERKQDTGTPAHHDSLTTRPWIRRNGLNMWWRSRLFLLFLAWSWKGGSWAGAGWIDPDSHPDVLAKEFEGRRFDLVFSDEFTRDGRTFRDGDDPRWTAANKNDYTNAALQYYSNDMVETRNGSMFLVTNNSKITFDYFDTPEKKFKKMTKTYMSSMIQSWNKFCFTGGIIEIHARLPGAADVGGLWPAMWLMGNLARATYTASSDFLWPWSYNGCNRSTEEKKGWQRQQEISACDSSVHYGFHPHVGRGAPEIDILEAMAGKGKNYPYISTSLQVSPGTNDDERPPPGMIPPEGSWYHRDIFYGKGSKLNKWFYGELLEHKPSYKSYYADAVSGNHQLNHSHFEDLHTYRLDWQPKGEDSIGYIRWYVDDEQVYGITSNTLAKNGAQIPVEPMYILLNTAVSSNWGFPPCPRDCKCDCWDASDEACFCALDPDFYTIFPAEYKVDWVRVYQHPNDSLHTVGCDPELYPTKDFISAHADRYMEPGDKVVLSPVKKGGGSCRSSDDCNGSQCHWGRQCKCSEGWTGPHCLAAEGSDDVVEKAQLWPIYEPIIPPALSTCLALIGGTFVITLIVRYSHRRKRLMYSRLDSSGVTIPPPARSFLR